MVETIRQTEIASLKSALSESDYKRVDAFSKSLVKKLLQHPIIHLKEAAQDDGSVDQIELIGDILGIHNND